MRPPKLFYGSAAVAVCTAYLTFGDFSNDPLPRPPLPHQVPDVSFFLTSNMVKLQNTYIALEKILF
jgi:hypothetical protein